MHVSYPTCYRGVACRAALSWYHTVLFFSFCFPIALFIHALFVCYGIVFVHTTSHCSTTTITAMGSQDAPRPRNTAEDQDKGKGKGRAPSQPDAGSRSLASTLRSTMATNHLGQLLSGAKGGTGTSTPFAGGRDELAQLMARDLGSSQSASATGPSSSSASGTPGFRQSTNALSATGDSEMQQFAQGMAPQPAPAPGAGGADFFSLLQAEAPLEAQAQAGATWRPPSPSAGSSSVDPELAEMHRELTAAQTDRTHAWRASESLSPSATCNSDSGLTAEQAVSSIMDRVVDDVYGIPPGLADLLREAKQPSTAPDSRARAVRRLQSLWNHLSAQPAKSVQPAWIDEWLKNHP